MSIDKAPDHNPEDHSQQTVFAVVTENPRFKASWVRRMRNKIWPNSQRLFQVRPKFLGPKFLGFETSLLSATHPSVYTRLVVGALLLPTYYISTSYNPHAALWSTKFLGIGTSFIRKSSSQRQRLRYILYQSFFDPKFLGSEMPGTQTTQKIHVSTSERR